MPEGHKEHRGVAVAVAVVLCRLDEPLDLPLSQMLAGSEVLVGKPFRGNCSIYNSWRDQP